MPQDPATSGDPYFLTNNPLYSRSSPSKVKLAPKSPCGLNLATTVPSVAESEGCGEEGITSPVFVGSGLAVTDELGRVGGTGAGGLAVTITSPFSHGGGRFVFAQ